MLLKNEKRTIIGYDLTNDCSQITVEEESYDIPTVLCKRVGANRCNIL